MSDVTQILNAIDAGDPQAASQLLPLVYDELRRLAAARMAQEKPGHTLDATALVHEAYLRMVQASHWACPRGPDEHHGDKPRGSPSFANRRHFFAAAAEAMRRILVESARRKGRIRHGGGRKREELSEAVSAPDAHVDELLAVDEALDQLTAEDPTAGEIVKLRFFAGLSVEDAGDTLGLARATAYRHWTYARAWLALRVRGESG